MGERSGGIGAAGNAERDLAAGNQLESAGLVVQARVRQGLKLIKHVELIGVGHVIEQLDWRKLRVHQSIRLQLRRRPNRQPLRHYHCAPRRLSIRRNVSYSEIMSPCAMTASGERPLKNSL